MKNKTKTILFFVMICSFIIIFFCVYNEKKIDKKFLYENEKKEIIKTRTLKKELFVNLKLDDMLCSYNSKNDTCLFNNNFDNEKKMKTKLYSYDKFDYITTNGKNAIYTIYEKNNDNFILLYNDKYYYEINVKFISIPLININYFIENKEKKDLFKTFLQEEEPITLKEKKDFFFQMYDKNNNTKIHDIGKIHVRGETSINYEKKSYKIELKNKYNLLGMRKDEDWILDALYIDKSKIRNKLSSDIWNTINNNQITDNDINGEFVEVFINNEYKGIYVIKEPIDKKTVKIEKNGLLAKSVGHVLDENIEAFIKNNVTIKKENDEIFVENYELKNYSNKTLNKFIKKIGNFYEKSRNFDSINENFDLKNYINYKIFIALISGEDNLSKNQFYSMKNENDNIIITPWDMDLTWGLIYNSENDMRSSFSMESSYDENWMNISIASYVDEQTKLELKKRYWELRKETINMETIEEYLNEYLKILTQDESTTRDSETWYEYNIDEEIENIKEWSRIRIEFLDRYFYNF